MHQTAEKNKSKVFIPGRIGNLELRNRTIRSGCFEGRSPHAAPSDALIEHHRKVAAGQFSFHAILHLACFYYQAVF